MTFPIKWDKETDVLVIGSGFAGLSAAIEAHDKGVPTTVLEKMDHYGGNSIIAGAIYNCVDPERQKAIGVTDSVQLHYEQTLAGGDYRGNPEKIRYLVEHALEGWQWLESMGIICAGVFQAYGALWPRSHSPVYKGKRDVGTVAECLYDQANLRHIPVLLNHRVTRIIREDCLEGRVSGVEVEYQGEKLFFKARRAVVLASGGFAANVLLRMKHDPRLDDRFTTSNHAGATGEIINMAADIGASTVGMDYIQVVGAQGRDIRVMPRPAPVMQDAPAVRLNAHVPRFVVYLNLKGERIAASDTRRDIIATAVFNTPEKVCVMVNDRKGIEAKERPFGALTIDQAMKFVSDNPKEVFVADTPRELAQKAGMDPGTLVKTIERYNSFVEAKKDPDFNQLPHNLTDKIDTPPFFAATGSPAVHFTMGGLDFDPKNCRVIDRWGKIIPGLYGAGEMMGGIHGANRLGCNATPICIVFGRLAGKTAAEEPSNN